MCTYANQLQIIIRILEHNFAKQTAEKISKYSAVRRKQSFGEENLIPISFWLISTQPGEGRCPCRGTTEGTRLLGPLPHVQGVQ